MRRRNTGHRTNHAAVSACNVPWQAAQWQMPLAGGDGGESMMATHTGPSCTQTAVNMRAGPIGGGGSKQGESPSGGAVGPPKSSPGLLVDSVRSMTVLPSRPNDATIRAWMRE